MPNWVLRPGTILEGKYEIGRSLGEGGFGITYLAWDLNMETRIAIKEHYPSSAVFRDTTNLTGNTVIKHTSGGVADYEESMKRFVKEASILSRFFDLPGIVSVKDFFYANDTAYFVMEYLDGSSLRDYLVRRGGVLGWEEALRLIEPVIRSLAVLHANNLLHRDISPDNIMIEKSGRIKLIDFGAARSTEQNSREGMTVMLKRRYAPIEQYSREAVQGPYTDVYGICATLYHMLTGNAPLDATDRARADHLIPVRKYNKKVPKHIAEAIEKGLSLNPEMRQQSMQELHQDLFISKQGLAGRRLGSLSGAITKILIVLAAILVLLVGVGIAYRLNYDKFEKVRSAARILSENDTSDPGDDSPDDEEDDREDDQESLKSDGDDETVENDIDETTENKEEEIKETGSVTERERSGDTDADVSAAEKEDQETVVSDPAAADPMKGLDRINTEDDAVATAIEAVQNGVLDAGGIEVGVMLDSYSDTPGIWDAYKDDDGTVYVKYSGTKAGTGFGLIFEITSTRSGTDQMYVSFRLCGALEDGTAVSDYNSYFRNIIDRY